ncbi:hypothetical protein HID58_038078 [Brassica napus]|uniref:Uncharacterized protein n=1 Tax=Brassica napus TaxID=3708 RepID=A0ABQ8B997_BRANA|nr:hypothetical protein HID58_040364 [Brassica napus]KAH0906251.1 hypothetical protein HID58_038078 [Brassica napus]
MLTLRGFDVVPCNKNFRLSDSLLAIWFRRQDTTCEDQSMFSFALQCRRTRSIGLIMFPAKFEAVNSNGKQGRQTKRLRLPAEPLMNVQTRGRAAQWVFFSGWFDGSEERTAPITIHDDDDAIVKVYKDDADDDDNPDGIPVPVQVETGEGSSDAVKDADEKADDHAPKKRIHSSTNAAKIVHV